MEVTGLVVVVVVLASFCLESLQSSALWVLWELQPRAWMLEFEIDGTFWLLASISPSVSCQVV